MLNFTNLQLAGEFGPIHFLLYVEDNYLQDVYLFYLLIKCLFHIFCKLCTFIKLFFLLCFIVYDVAMNLLLSNVTWVFKKPRMN
jgi:hypothetical protein